MQKKTRITFVQKGLKPIAITTNNIRLANALVERGYGVDIVGTNDRGDIEHLLLDGVTVFKLNCKSPLRAIFALSAYFRSRRPNIVLASGPSVNVAAYYAKLMSGAKFKLVQRVHAHTSIHLKDRSRLRRFILLFLMKRSHRNAFLSISPCRGASDDLADLMGIPRDEVGVLYNPAVDDALILKSKCEVSHPWIDCLEIPVIITAARLAPQKSIDVLIRALKIVTDCRPARLIILGDGPLKPELTNLAERLGVSALVDFHGHVENPYKFISKADVFALSSNYEGFANVIAEALACGCPVVSTDAPSGPREILDDGEFGTLVPVGDENALATEIMNSIDQLHDKSKLTTRAKDFHVNKIVSNFLVLVDESACD